MLDWSTTISSSSVKCSRNIVEYCVSVKMIRQDKCAHNDLTIYTWNTNAIEYNENSACWCQFNRNFSFNWLVNLSVVVADSFANYEGKDKSLLREPATCAKSTLGLVGSRQSFCLEEDHYRQRHHHHHHHHHHYRVLQEVVNLSAQKLTISCSSKCSSRAFDLRLRHLLIFASKPGIETGCYQSYFDSFM